MYHDTLQSMVQLAQDQISLKSTKQEETPDVKSEVTPGFPDRPPESHALFASTVAGPLFTSSTHVLPDKDLLELPSHLHIIRVLPTAATECRAIEDMYQMPTTAPGRDILESAREPIFASKSVRLTPYESFAPHRDTSGAIIDQRTINMCNLNKQRSANNNEGVVQPVASIRKKQIDTAKEEAGPRPEAARNASDQSSIDATAKEGISQDDDNQVVPMDVDPLQFDVDFLETFETEAERNDNISSMLIELSTVQTDRIAQSPFSAPSSEENDLAARITERLQQQIATTDVTPKQLLSRGVRGDYTFARFTPSFTGTLPPTIAQAVRATYSQVLPLRSHPLSRPSTPTVVSRDMRQATNGPVTTTTTNQVR